jgi:hypothetical protein
MIFCLKIKLKVKLERFSFKDGKVIQELDIYKTENKNLLNSNFFLIF